MASAALRPGATLDGDKYRILRLLGSGGMGSVFEAEHTRTHKRVAIKGIHPAQAASSPAAARLVREAQAAARIRHPNVVDVYDVIVDGGTMFLVMEYLEGETLSALLARNELPPHAIIALLLPAMRGVAEAHKCGVIHRDLKPDNIFLAREGERESPTPKVLDFGISKLEGRDADQLSLTGSGHLLGTPKYMSIEQLAGERDIDARADVYAVGVILYEALTGQLPYPAQSFPELVYKITTSTPIPAKQLRPELPGSLDRLVDWALAHDRSERIESMEDFIRELEPFSTAHGYRAELELADDGGGGAPDAQVPARLPRISNARSSRVSQPPPKRSYRYVTLLVLAVAALVSIWLGTGSGAESGSQAAASAPVPPLPAAGDLTIVEPHAAESPPAQARVEMSATVLDVKLEAVAAPGSLASENSASLAAKLPPAKPAVHHALKRKERQDSPILAPLTAASAVSENFVTPKPVVETTAPAAVEAPLAAEARRGFRVINPPKSTEF